MVEGREHPVIFPVLTESDGSAIAVSLAAYTANDVVGALLKCSLTTDKGGHLVGVYITDQANQSEPYIVHVYKSEPSTIADAAAFAPTDADAALEIGTVSVAAGDYATAAGSAYSKAYVKGDWANIDIPADPTRAGTNKGVIYIYLQCTSTPDYAAAGDLLVDFLILLN